jgi:hypothetical protein
MLAESGATVVRVDSTLAEIVELRGRTGCFIGSVPLFHIVER